MNTQGKCLAFRLFVNITLGLSLVLSGVLTFSFTTSSSWAFPEQTLFQLLLLNTLLILTSLALMDLFGGKYWGQSSADKQDKEKLTGCMTRHSFSPLYEKMLQDSKESGQPLTLLLVDIDHFKRINDSHGHLLGDDLLSLLGETVRSVFRTSDISCRWAGDQILVALKNCTACNGGRLAEKLLEKVRLLEVVKGTESITFTASIGIAQMIKGDTAESLVARVETGLYSACDAGRNTSGVGYDWIVIEYYCDPIY